MRINEKDEGMAGNLDAKTFEGVKKIAQSLIDHQLSWRMALALA